MDLVPQGYADQPQAGHREKAPADRPYGGITLQSLLVGCRRACEAHHYKNVHTDVTSLVELGLLDRGEDGRLSTPYDECLCLDDPFSQGPWLDLHQLAN